MNEGPERMRARVRTNTSRRSTETVIGIYDLRSVIRYDERDEEPREGIVLKKPKRFGIKNEEYRSGYT